MKENKDVNQATPHEHFPTPPHLHRAKPTSTLVNVFLPWGILWREGTDHAQRMQMLQSRRSCIR